MAQGDIQENVANISFEADHQRFRVLTAFRTMLGGVQYGRMHAEMKSLVVESCDRVANYLVGQFANRFAHQFVRFRQFGCRRTRWPRAPRWRDRDR